MKDSSPVASKSPRLPLQSEKSEAPTEKTRTMSERALSESSTPGAIATEVSEEEPKVTEWVDGRGREGERETRTMSESAFTCCNKPSLM